MSQAEDLRLPLNKHPPDSGLGLLVSPTTLTASAAYGRHVVAYVADYGSLRTTGRVCCPKNTKVNVA
jgi:hypothetical protein